MTFSRIPAGQFAMGFDHSGSFEELIVAFPRSITPRDVAGNERPRHQVRISRPFEMVRHEVTVGQFRKFCEATGYRTTAESTGAGVVGFSPTSSEQVEQTGKRRPFAVRPKFTWRNPGFEQNDFHPVVGVSWTDADAFCRWLTERFGTTYRLPTEAEWEYACRAGAKEWFSFGNSFRDQIHHFANVADARLERSQPGMATRQWLFDADHGPDDGFPFTAPVGSFTANEWGLCDMHGNVWEWCRDRFLEDAYRRRTENGDPVINPINRKAQDDLDDWRVIRGGAWCTGPIMCRSSTRGFYAASQSACYIGFRVMREIQN